MVNRFAMTPEEQRRLEMEQYSLDMAPGDEDALVRGEYIPERLSEFQRKRANEENRLRGQMEQAYRIANTPIEVQGNTTGANVASIVANALRTFGGYAMARNSEKDLAAAQAASEQEHEGLMGGYENAARAGLRAKRKGLSGALINYGTPPGET